MVRAANACLIALALLTVGLAFVPSASASCDSPPIGTRLAYVCHTSDCPSDPNGDALEVDVFGHSTCISHT